MQTRHAAPAFVCAREVLSQVTEGECTEHGIAQGMYHHVSIGVPIQTSFVRNRHATEHKRTSCNQGMDIVTEANTHRDFQAPSRRNISQKTRSSGVVILTLCS